MKKILTLTLLLIALGAKAQKHTRYFSANIDFQSSDGCPHSQRIWFLTKGATSDYDALFKDIKKYIKPYKITKGTFKINDYQQITYAEWKKRSAAKFEPCKDFSSRVIQALSLSSDTHTYFNSTLLQWKQPSYSFNVEDAGTVLRVSSPDSLGIITVTFHPSLVKFINDSTFTYKQNK